MMREHEMKIGELMLASLPMSVGAIALIGLGMWFWYSGRELSVELTRTLFIGLSAIAVPHLALNALPKRRFDNIEGLAAEVRGVA